MYVRVVLTSLSVSTLLLGSVSAQSIDSYPSRPITLIVPFGSGGGPDIFARFVADKASARLGQAIVVENKVGAGGTVATGAASKAKPDGYTLLIGTNGTMGMAPVMYDNVAYDPRRDFVGITTLTKNQFVLSVTPQSAISNLQDFIADLKANPGKRAFGVTGVGTLVHSSATEFLAATGTKALAVPYRNMPAVLTDLLGGRLDFYVDVLSSTVTLANSGRIRPIALLNSSPNPLAPGIPALSTVGIQNFNMMAWDAVLVPANTPAAVTQKLNQAFVGAINDPETKRFFAERNTEAFALPLNETADFLKKEIPRWAEIAKKSGAKGE